MAWELGSGNRTDYDFYIQQAYFAPDAAYQNGETTLLHLIGIDDEGEEVTDLFNVGKEWVSPDGGKTVRSSKGHSRISKNSMYGKFLVAVMSLSEDVAKQFEARGDANEAAVWVGAAFHMDEQELSFGRNLDNVFKNLPSAFLGFDVDGVNASGGNTPQPVAAKPKPAGRPVAAVKKAASPLEAAKARAAAAKASVAPAPAPADDNTQLLIDLAKSSPDFSTFVDAAIEIPEVQADDELLTFVTNPEPDGFYTLYHV